jgi:GT2 family glycosyltransferase
MTAGFDDPKVGIAFGPVESLTHWPSSEPTTLEPGPAPLAPWLYSHGASIAFRKEGVIDVGGFDERLGPGRYAGCGEEPDLIVRLKARGWSCVIADAPPVQHLEWRDAEESFDTLMRYERGSGAWLGKAVRRDRLAMMRMLYWRLRFYQADTWREPARRGRWFGLRATASFCAGFLHGLGYPERRFL